jgi:hypothetical protein
MRTGKVIDWQKEAAHYHALYEREKKRADMLEEERDDLEASNYHLIEISESC